MVSVGYKNLVFEDEDGYFSAPKMLSRWREINVKQQNPFLATFNRAMNHWLKISEDKLKDIITLGTMANFHNQLAIDIIWKSEIHKDLKPNSPIYNVSEGLNEYYLYFKNIYQLELFRSKEIEKIGDDLQLSASRCHGMTAYWNTERRCPTIKDYIIHAQSYPALRASVDMMRIFSDVQEEFAKLIKYITLLDFLYNDHKGLVEELNADDSVKIGKITHKIYTFPVVYSVNTYKELHQLETVMRFEKHENGLKEFILKTLEENGTLSFSENNINRLRDLALNEVERLGGNKLLEEWIKGNFIL